MISPYSRFPGQTTNRVRLPNKPYPRRTNERKRARAAPFGPESVPLATGSVSVVYWVPGPFPRPTPSSRISAAGPRLSVRLASPVLDWSATYP
jgi:hypothetical protein